jgi:UDPglucose 6-dehydrogenase
LDELLKIAIQNGLEATTQTGSAVKKSDFVFICVGTPSRKDGSVDLRQVKTACEEIGEGIRHASTRKRRLIVVKSTVPPGTTEKLIIPTVEKFSRKKAIMDFGICVNPEFLREGNAINDFLFPLESGIVIGEIDALSGTALLSLLRQFAGEILRTDLITAEMIKYARNCYLAKDISYANEIANICQKIGVDYLDVKKGMELDKRIGKGRFLKAGIGFGGSCLPKDLKALMLLAKAKETHARVIEATLKTNQSQPHIAVELLKRNLNSIANKKITVLGLSFKPQTDDTRESPSFVLIEELLSNGAMVSVYDPTAIEATKRVFRDRISYFDKPNEALSGSDACVIATEWPEFQDTSIYEGMAHKITIDGRRILDPKSLPRDFSYSAVGYPLTRKSQKRRAAMCRNE